MCVCVCVCEREDGNIESQMMPVLLICSVMTTKISGCYATDAIDLTLRTWSQG